MVKSSSKPERARAGLDALQVGKLVATPGTCVRGDIPVARLPTQGWLELPVAVFNGAQPGPCIWLNGAIHGDELNGVEIIRELSEQLRPERLAGAVIAVPVVNVFGFVSRSRYTPDRRDLNRSFPGSRRGSLASRIAALFMREVVARCELGIDLHTAAEGRINEPQVRCDFEDQGLRELAGVFGTSIALHARPAKGTLRAAAAKHGVPVLLYEGGQAGRFDDDAVEAGLRGIKRVMRHLGMYAWRVTKPKLEQRAYTSSRWVRAPRSGLYRERVRIGAEVVEGDRLGTIGDTLGESNIDVRAPLSGKIIGGTTHPLVHQGDGLLHIAELEGETRDDPAAP